MILLCLGGRKMVDEQKKKGNEPKTKHPCACGMVFRHRYLLVRHVRLAHHEICPKCFGTVKTYSNENGDTIDCQFCWYKEHFNPGELGRMNEKARDRHAFSFYPVGYVGK
jgi:hypothetical protein